MITKNLSKTNRNLIVIFLKNVIGILRKYSQSSIGVTGEYFMINSLGTKFNTFIKIPFFPSMTITSDKLIQYDVTDILNLFKIISYNMSNDINYYYNISIDDDGVLNYTSNLESRLPIKGSVYSDENKMSSVLSKINRSIDLQFKLNQGYLKLIVGNAGAINDKNLLMVKVFPNGDIYLTSGNRNMVRTIYITRYEGLISNFFTENEKYCNGFQFTINMSAYSNLINMVTTQVQNGISINKMLNFGIFNLKSRDIGFTVFNDYMHVDRYEIVEPLDLVGNRLEFENLIDISLNITQLQQLFDKYALIPNLSKDKNYVHLFVYDDSISVKIGTEQNTINIDINANINKYLNIDSFNGRILLNNLFLGLSTDLFSDDGNIKFGIKKYRDEYYLCIQSIINDDNIIQSYSKMISVSVTEKKEETEGELPLVEVEGEIKKEETEGTLPLIEVDEEIKKEETEGTMTLVEADEEIEKEELELELPLIEIDEEN